MVVSCSKCGTKFKIADDKISASGVKVRCSKCKHTFVVSSGGVSEVDAAAKEAAPASKPPAAPAASPKPAAPLPPPTAAAGSSPGSVPPPPVAPEAPLPPPPRVVDRAGGPGAFPPAAGSLPDDIFSSPTKVGPAPTDDADPLGALPLPPPPPPAAVPSAFGQPPAGGPPAGIDLDADFPLADADSLPASTRADLADDPSGAPLSDGPTQRVPAPAGQAGGSAAGPGIALPEELGEGLFDDLDAAVDQTLGEQRPSSSQMAGDLPPPPAPPPPPAASEFAGDAADAIPGFETAAQGGLGADPGAQAAMGDDPFAGVDLNLPAVEAAAPPMASSAADFMMEAAEANAPAAAAPPAAPSGDDPFSGINLDVAPSEAGPAAPGADPFADISLEAPPGPAAAGGAAGGDMFDGLGDPFAGMEPAPSPPAAAPPPLPAQTGASDGADLFGPDEIVMDSSASPASAGGADPFAALDTGGAEPTSAMDMSVGHDPFGSLDTADDGMPMDEGPQLGLAMDADGRLGGKDLPAPPPHTKAMAGPSQALGDQPPQVVARPPGPPPMAPSAMPEEGGRTSLPVKIGFGLVLLVLALFVFVVYRHGGKPDLTRWSTYVEAFTGRGPDAAVTGDLVARGLSSTAYPNRDGHSLVVLWGEVDNSSKEAKKGIVIRGQLLGEDDKVLEEQTVPAGVTFGPLDIHAMVDDHSVGDAYRTRYAKAPKELASGASLPFMVVMFDHPDDLASVRVRAVPAESQDPLGTLPAPAPPAADQTAAAADEDVAPLGPPAKPASIKPGPKAARPRGAGGKLVKKTGTVVRLGPKAPAPAGKSNPP